MRFTGYFLVIAFLLQVLRLHAQTAQLQVEYGDRVKIGYLMYHPVTFSPMIKNTEYERKINQLIFGDGLFTRNNEGNVINGLAETSFAEEDRVWRIKLKSNIYFHDRTQMTSEDVKFTYELYKKFALQSHVLFDVRYVSTVEVFDDLNLRIILNRPLENFRETIGQLPILRKAIYRKWLDFNLISMLPDVIPAVGCGYFIHRPLNNDMEIRLDVNRFHYNSRANLDGIDFVFFDREEELVEAFIQEKIDVIQIQGSTVRQKLLQIANSFQFLPAYRDDLKLYYINLNITRAPFNDLSIRKAVNYAIDKDLIIEKYLENKGHVASNVLDEKSAYYLDISDLDKYDPLRSIDILQLAGYRRQETGKLFKNSNELKFEFYFEEDSPYQESVVRLIAINLGELGVNVLPIPLKPYEIKRRLSEGRYQAALQHFVYDPISVIPVLRQFYLEELNKGDGFKNFNERFINQRIDISGKTFQESDLRQIAVQIQDRIINKQPCIFLFIEDRAFYAFHKRISHVKNIVIQNYKPILKLYPIQEWYVEIDQQKY